VAGVAGAVGPTGNTGSPGPTGPTGPTGGAGVRYTSVNWNEGSGTYGGSAGTPAFISSHATAWYGEPGTAYVSMMIELPSDYVGGIGLCYKQGANPVYVAYTPLLWFDLGAPGLSMPVSVTGTVDVFDSAGWQVGLCTNYQLAAAALSYRGFQMFVPGMPPL
jgi:hypothetical protein